MSNDFTPKELDQAARREAATFTDQFGRKWQAIVDTLAKGTCSAISPKNFVDRIDTPQKYLRAVTQDRTLTVDIDRWIEDLEAAHRRYQQELMDLAYANFRENAPKMVEERAPSLMRIMGEPPQPTEPLKAARAGNKYCLGTSDEMPAWAEKFFVKPAVPVEEYPDVEDEYLDVEEQFDPKATGGKKEKIKTKQALEAA